MVRVVLSGEVREQLVHVPPEPKRRIRQALRALESATEPGEPLERELKGFWKIAVGTYRIIYRHDSHAFQVVTIRPRSDVYEYLTGAVHPCQGHRLASEPSCLHRLPFSLSVLFPRLPSALRCRRSRRAFFVKPLPI